jgi:hypothetical protein
MTTQQFDETLREFQSKLGVAFNDIVHCEFLNPIYKMLEKELAEVFATDVIYQLVKRTGHRLSDDLYRLHMADRVYECEKIDEEFATIIENALIRKVFALSYGFDALFMGRQAPVDYPVDDSIFPYKNMEAFCDYIAGLCVSQTTVEITEDPAAAVSDEVIEC